MRTTRTIISFALLMVILSGCGAPAIPSPPPASSISISIETSTPTSISTYAPPTYTPAPSPTLEPTSDAHFVRRCLQEDDQERTLKAVTSGTLVQADTLLEIQTGRKYPLPFSPFKSAQKEDRYGSPVSPNRKLLAYLETVQNTQQILWVVDAHAQVLAKIPFERNDLSRLRWLDNERVIMYTTQTNRTGSVLVINPFTGAQTSVFHELPFLLTDTDQTWLIEYSPDLQWVVYLSEKVALVMVRDVVTQETVWQSLNPDYEGRPAWSPDGQQLAVVGGALDAQQVYLVDRSRQIKPMLDEDRDKRANNYTLTWSPAGQQIAFWRAENLLVYDRQRGEVIDLCILNNTYPYHNPVRWSPDSQQFVTYGRLETHAIREGFGPIEKGSLRVVDIQKGMVYTNVAKDQNLDPNMWMDSMP